MLKVVYLIDQRKINPIIQSLSVIDLRNKDEIKCVAEPILTVVEIFFIKDTRLHLLYARRSNQTKSNRINENKVKIVEQWLVN